MRAFGGNQIQNELKLKALSLTARLAMALHCLRDYCSALALHHIEIELFLEDLWEFPLIESDRWDQWEQGHPPLVHTALGDDWPVGFEDFLGSRKLKQQEFRYLIENVTEIVFGSFYGATDN